MSTDEQPWQRHPITDPSQAYVAGLIVGVLRQHGIDAEPVLDPHGDYTAAMWLKLPPGLYGNVELSVLVVVPGKEESL